MKIRKSSLQKIIKEEVKRYQRVVLLEGEAGADFFKMHNQTRKLWRVIEILRILVERRTETGPITNEDAWGLLSEGEGIVRELVESAEELEYKYSPEKAQFTQYDNAAAGGMFHENQNS